MGDAQEAEYMSVAVEEPGKKTANNTNSRGKSSSIRAHSVKCVKRRTSLEKLLIFLLFVVLLFVILLIVGLIVQSKKGSTICLTKECVATAGALIENMDPDADPCQDFYQYSCGGWLKKTVIPEDKGRITILRQLQERLLVHCRGLLEEEATPNDTDAELKVKYLYQTCIDEESVEVRDIDPLLKFIDELGGWPVISEDFNEDSWILEDILATIRLKNDMNYLFIQKVMEDIQNASKNLIYLDQPPLGMNSREYFLFDRSDKMVQAYLNYMTSLVIEIRPNVNRTLLATEVDAVYDFESNLANMSLPLKQRGNLMKLFEKLTIGRLGQLAPGINWLRYVRLVFDDQTIDENDELCTLALPYLIGMAELVQKTPKRVLANFFMWRVTMGSVEHLSSRLRQHRLAFRRVADGEKAAEPRWSTCVKRATTLMSNVAGYMYIRRYFDERSKVEAKDMVQNIRHVLLDTLENTEWMDESTRTKALEKARSTEELIGYNELLTNIDVVNHEYANVNISRNHLFENIVELWKNSAKHVMSQRDQPQTESDAISTPITVNAYFLNHFNRIYFAAGILQPPFYSRHYLKAINYGGIGMVIGHELTHGFDNKGRSFDRNGKLREWFSPESLKSFNEKVQCLIDQYSNFSSMIDGEKIPLDGVATQGENIADNGGLKQAFTAYRRWVAQRGSEEPQLPGLGLTGNQLFFVNFGQIWCSMYRPQALKDVLINNSHPPQMFRVLGSIANSPEFAEAYNCPAGSPMNPVKKCKVW